MQECDKEASWDGDLLLYRENDFRVENIEYKIPVQVKGKNDNSLLKKTEQKSQSPQKTFL